MTPNAPVPTQQPRQGLGLLLACVRAGEAGSDRGWRVVVWAWAALALLVALAPGFARAEAASDTDALAAHVRALLQVQPQAHKPNASAGAPEWRVEVTLGQLDPRIKLAPCEKVHAYLPQGAQLWGPSHVGLRCEKGTVRWNVHWPVRVQVWSSALVAAVPLRPGSIVGHADVTLAEVDLAASRSPALRLPADIVGRSVVRAIAAGQSLRQDDVKARRWFAAGDPVRLHVRGPGFLVASEGVALSHGDEGQCARVRTEQGRVLCGQPVGERLVEVTL